MHYVVTRHSDRPAQVEDGIAALEAEGRFRLDELRHIRERAEWKTEEAAELGDPASAARWQAAARRANEALTRLAGEAGR